MQTSPIFAAHSNSGKRAARVVWAGRTGHFITAGFSDSREREIKVWDPRNTAQPGTVQCSFVWVVFLCFGFVFCWWLSFSVGILSTTPAVQTLCRCLCLHPSAHLPTHLSDKLFHRLSILPQALGSTNAVLACLLVCMYLPILSSSVVFHPPVLRERVDASTGILNMHYDTDTDLVVVTGKGDVNLRIFQ